MNRHASVEKVAGNVVAGNFTLRPAQERGCKDCATRSFCLPGTAARGEPQELQGWVDHGRPVPAGKSFYHQGAAFDGMFFVRSGAVKTFRSLLSGDEQVTGFHLPGDLFGVEGWQPGCYPTSAIALETTSVCFLPIKRLQSAGTASTILELQNQLLAKVSELLNRQYELSCVLSYNKALERIAAFLLDLSSRYGRRHLSASGFRLPMSRTDLSCYLGLSLECVSRGFAQLEKAGHIDCSGRNVTIVDGDALSELAGESMPANSAIPLRPL